MQKATLHRAAHQNFPTQQASHGFLWSLYRSALTGMHATGILRLVKGKNVVNFFCEKTEALVRGASVGC